MLLQTLFFFFVLKHFFLFYFSPILPSFSLEELSSVFLRVLGFVLFFVGSFIHHFSFPIFILFTQDFLLYIFPIHFPFILSCIFSFNSSSFFLFTSLFLFSPWVFFPRTLPFLSSTYLFKFLSSFIPFQFIILCNFIHLHMSQWNDWKLSPQIYGDRHSCSSFRHCNNLMRPEYSAHTGWCWGSRPRGKSKQWKMGIGLSREK